MTLEEKEVMAAALDNYIIAIKDELTQQAHSEEEVIKYFHHWNLAEKLVKKYSK